MASARRGPTPLTPVNASNSVRSPALANPYRSSDSSRTTRTVNRDVSPPVGGRDAAVVAETRTSRPAPPTSTTGPSGSWASTRPLMDRITGPR